MKRLRDLLFRFRNLRPPEKLVEEEFKSTIREMFGVPETLFNVVYKNSNFIVISDNSVLKSEIFTKKKEIIKRTENRLNRKIQANVLFK